MINLINLGLYIVLSYFITIIITFIIHIIHHKYKPKKDSHDNVLNTLYKDHYYQYFLLTNN